MYKQLSPQASLRQYSTSDRLTHDIALNLQFPAHKQLLRIRLALNQLLELCIVQNERDVRLLALRRDAPAYSAALLQVNVP